MTQPQAETTADGANDHEKRDPGRPSSASSALIYRLLPIVLCLIAFAAFAAAAREHPLGAYWTETDFYHFYGPDAKRIASGQFPENPYQGPGFPALVALVAKLTGDVFSAGKWISVVSATLVVALTFLLFSRLFSYWIGLGAAALVPVSAQVPQFAICATTDALFLMLSLATLVCFLDDRLGVRWRVLLGGILAGLAYLVRYNGIFLIATMVVGIIVVNLFSIDWRGRVKLTLLILGTFLITASPWLYANYRHRGSPFYNTNYLNIAAEFYPELAEGRTNQDGTRELETIFTSFGDVLTYDLRRMLRHYPLNLGESFVQTIRSDLVSPLTGWLALLGFAILLIKERRKPILVVLTATLLYFLLMGLSHWETRYYFFMMTIYSGVAVYAAAFLGGLFGRRWLLAVPGVMFVVMWSTSFVMARKDLTHFLGTHPTEILSACDFLKQRGVKGARIVARKPHLPVICDQQWVFFPQVGSLEELKAWLAEHPSDYVLISSVELKRRRELSALKSPATAPPWLEAVWENKDPLMILYAYRRGR